MDLKEVYNSVCHDPAFSSTSSVPSETSGLDTSSSALTLEEEEA